MVGFPGPIAVTKQYGGALQHAKYSIKLMGIKGYEKQGRKLRRHEKPRLQYRFIQTQEPEYWMEEMLRSLVAPLPRGRRASLP